MAYIQQILGNNIKKYREANRISIEQLAAKVGISYQSLSKIERGKGFATAETFEKICESLHLTPEQLFSLEGALPDKIYNEDDIKPFLHQIINNIDNKKANALYKLIQAFLEVTD